ncbi:cytochrome b/b6 domain-containing protein [Ahniella affigens]|uniref:cytochrome b/b6 domain-containing protein n=1 Tax=Ahniella affigens TaxID=2021234 RepID=UPI001474F395|nr:cytochrome b/b6 domain-containing protein [Ahniella affigens]
MFDRIVRSTHWLIAVGIVATWFTRHARGAWHEWLGYGVAAVLLLRLLWGLIGSRHARFADFMQSPLATIRYARKWWAGTAPRFLGHNPLGGWMIVTIWTTLAVVLVTGYLFTTDRWFGIEWVIETHAISTWVLLGLIPIHVIGVLLASYRDREHLILAMIHGRKPEVIDGQTDPSGTSAIKPR